MHTARNLTIFQPMYAASYLMNYFMHLIGSLSGRVNNAFIDDFRHNILNNKTEHPEFIFIEQYRSSIYKCETRDEFKDLGAGTRSFLKRRTIGNAAKSASVNPKYGRLLFHLARHYQPDMIVELGTAVGIGTMYLACGNPKARVITVEGNPQYAEIASGNFVLNSMHNIIIINSTFDTAISRLLPEITKNTLFFIDGNHTLKATRQYFEVFGKIPESSGILVFDDINWSPEMSQAWKSIILSEDSGVAVDLFQMGILFQGRERQGQVFHFMY